MPASFWTWDSIIISTLQHEHVSYVLQPTNTFGPIRSGLWQMETVEVVAYS